MGSCKNWTCENATILKIYQEALPTEDMLLKCNAIVRTLTEATQSFCETASFHAYGSLASNLFMPGSDVDLCIRFEGLDASSMSKNWRAKVLRLIGDILFRIQSVRRGSYQCIARARIPVISFIHSPAELEVDINTIDSGIFKAMFIRQLMSINCTLGPLIRIAKAWARCAHINDPKHGTMNSFCLSLLAVFHLQQLPGNQLPPVWKLLRAVDSDGDISSVKRPMACGASPGDEQSEVMQAATKALIANDPASILSLETVVTSFFSHMAAVCLLRFSGRSIGLTVSCWKAELATDHCKAGSARKKKRSGSQAAQDAQASIDASESIVYLINTICTHWPPEAHAMKAQVLHNVMITSQLLLSPAKLDELRQQLRMSQKNDDKAWLQGPVRSVSPWKLKNAADSMLGNIVLADDAKLKASGISADAVRVEAEAEDANEDNEDDDEDYAEVVVEAYPEGTEVPVDAKRNGVSGMSNRTRLDTSWRQEGGGGPPPPW